MPRIPVSDLNSADFAAREQATRELKRLAETLEPRVRRELKRASSLEVRLRLREIVETLPVRVPPLETVRELRAIAVLEQIATPEAGGVLQA
jgi:hypothetical protein